MKLSQLIEGMEVTSVKGDLSREAGAVTYDSRKVTSGDVFCTWKGLESDGHAYVPAAVEAGASALVIESEVEVPEDVTVVEVPSGRRALAQLSARYYRNPAGEMRVVGITGTNGKTSTAYLLHSILRASGLRVGLIGTIEYRIGDKRVPASRTTPESVEIQAMLRQMLDEGCEAVVMEVSSHALDQSRVAEIPFEVGIFTQLSRDHLDYHGDMESYFMAKARLFKDLPGGATAVLNSGNAEGRSMATHVPKGVRIHTYAVDREARHMASRVACRREGSRFIWKGPQGEVEVRTPWLGNFNVENCLAAMAAADAMGISREIILKAVEQAPPVPGRMEPVSDGDLPFSILVDYAHTHEALARVLETLRPLATNRLKVLIGCGGNRDAGKRPEMGRVACELADEAIFTSDNPRDESPVAILDDMVAGLGSFSSCQVVVEREEAIRSLIRSASPGDILLVAGKGHETSQEVAGQKIPFSDAAIIRDELERGRL
jgi:UDP-N-acetylmuramoyl-L-alanyl-D-glutamate--2,6-diaminopimelate ligase